MKNLKLISTIPLLIFIISLFLPYVEHTTTWPEKSIIIEHGYDLGMIFLPFGIMIFILFLVNTWRTRLIAIVSFVLCFGILFSLFLLQFQMNPVSSNTTHSIQIGYPIALLSVPILMVILLINLVQQFNQSKRNQASIS